MGHHPSTVMIARSVFFLALGVLAPSAARATPYTLTATDREAIATLARTFFEAIRRGDREMNDVFPTRAELRGLFPPALGVDGLVLRHAEALARDAQALHETFRHATFVGVVEGSYRRGVIDLAPCGRFARASSRCGDGPIIEYDVDGRRRRLRIDTLVRLGTRWRVFDVRP